MPKWVDLSGTQKMWFAILGIGFFSWAGWESKAVIDETFLLHEIQKQQSIMTVDLARQQSVLTSFSTELRASLNETSARLTDVKAVQSERGIRLATMRDSMVATSNKLDEIESALGLLQIYVYPQHKLPPGFKFFPALKFPQEYDSH